ncbi:MAG: WYL domain-containing protein [Gammaproteobacteria bacterium]|nr:WYL domain-containing protein [Gammaproteobacteria bacterium]
MATLDNIYHLAQILKSRRYPVSEATLMRELECSRSTLFRTIETLRERFGAPIENRRGQGYVYAKGNQDFELPGTWFRAQEIEALLVMDNLIARLQPGVLDDRVAALREKLAALLDKSTVRPSPKFPRERFRVLPSHIRELPSRIFELVAQSLIERRQLRFQYRNRGDGAEALRETSPQRLVHYKDHWYLDAWDERKDALRTFALDRMRDVIIASESARDVDADMLDDALMQGYGLFSGEAKEHATLVFSASRAEWVSEETWHPDQQGRFLDDGCYELVVPYSDSRELVGEILRHGQHVRVESPDALVREVSEALQAALMLYQRNT